MTSRELIRQTASCRNNARIPYIVTVELPMWEGAYGPEAVFRIETHLSQMPKDVWWENYGHPAGWHLVTNPDTGYVMDEWGAGWSEYVLDHMVTGFPNLHPLAAGYDKLEQLPFPDPRASGRFDSADKGIPAAREEGRYILGMVIPNMLQNHQYMRGFADALVDPYVERAQFERLRDKLTEFDLEIVRQWVERGVDGILFGDDWGSEHSMLMNPDDWRTHYLSSYQKLFDEVRSGGAQVWMHSDGNIIDILPDLVDAGLNVLNPVARCLDKNRLVSEFGGRVCFFGGVDAQDTLPFGTPESIRDEVRRLCDQLGATGGYYAAPTTFPIMPGVPLENLIALFEAFEATCV